MSSQKSVQVQPGNEPDAPTVPKLVYPPNPAPAGASRFTCSAPTIPKLAYSPKEAATALGVAPISVYRLLKRGALKSSSALRHKMIPVTELQRFLADTTQ
jgi:hypothetical protein